MVEQDSELTTLIQPYRYLHNSNTEPSNFRNIIQRAWYETSHSKLDWYSAKFSL